MMRRVPVGFIAALAGLGALATILLLTWFGVPPFDNILVFVLANVVSFFVILALGVLGGAFLGMIFMHRYVQNREFTPLEQRMLQAITEVRDASHRLERMEDELVDRLETLEKRIER